MERINLEINQSQLEAFIKACNQVSDAVMGWNNKPNQYRVNIYIESPLMERLFDVVFLAGYIHAQLIKQN